MDRQQLVDINTAASATGASATTTPTGPTSHSIPDSATDSIAVHGNPQRHRLSPLAIPSMETPEPASAAADWSLPHALGAASPLQPQQPPPLPLPPPPPYPYPEALVKQRRTKPGILRLDINKPRRSSGGSVEFRAQPQMLGEDITSPTSGTSSPHQLSVTWATPCDTNEPESKLKPLPGFPDAAPAAAASFVSERAKSSLQEEKSYELFSPVDAIDSPLQSQLNENDGRHNNNNSDAEDDDEDYSISVSAIIQRRASVRGYRNKRGSRYSRRASSPMDHLLDNIERRRSSVYTSSSDEGTNQESTQEQIFENIRLHKEVIQSVKLQPWPMRKKLKLVRQAKTYVARHEGVLQERFAMSRSTKDLWARFKILMAARWLHWKRETASFLTVLIPWELRIKEIESHFGSGVASYFTFLRWLMWVNIMIAIPLVAFVIGPEYFATKKDETDPRKRMSEHEFKVAGNLFTFWEFGGYLKYSPMFYGYYSSTSGASSLGYRLPMAYFLTAVVVYIYSFVATLRKMAENSRNSKLSSKDDECTFSWKLFTGWDFMIGHAETAHNRVASVVVGFKEALLEEAEKKKDKRNWRIILQRILINLVVMGLLAASGYTVVALVNKSEDLARQDNWLSRNAVNVTMTLLSFFLPMIFEALGLFENWHPRQQLRLQLARIMILNMLNLYSLMFSFIYNINSKEKPLQELKIKNETATSELLELSALIESLTTTTTTTLAYGSGANAASFIDYSSLSTDFDGSGSGSTITETMLTSTAATVLSSIANRLKCYNITVKCSKPKRVNNRTFATTTMLLINLTTALVPLTTDSSTTWSTQPTIMTTTEATTPPITEQLTTLILTTPPPSPADIASVPTITDAHSETTTAEDASTTPPSTSTTTPSPGNDTFFEYNDYFVGMPIELEESEEAEGELKPRTPSYGKRKASTSRVRPTRNAKQPRALIRRQREADAPRPTTSPMRKSKYSRRRDDEQNDSLEVDDAGSATATAPTTTLVTTTMSTTTTTSTSTTPTTKNKTKRQQDESSSVLQSWNDSSLPLWVDKEKLQEVLAYFTSSTTTIDPPSTTKPTTKATTTEATTDASTPFFIDDDDIEEISDVTYYDINEFDEENFEYCVRTVCEEISGDMFTSTTEMDPNASPRTDVAVSTLTPLEQHQLRLSQVKLSLSEIEKNLTSMCWETSLGQELSKVIVFDGLMSLLAPLCIDFLRGLFVRYVNQYWCWDMEKTFPEYGDFKIAENILTLINNQGQVWMGIFFSPGLVLVNLVKLVIMMYFRSWIVLTCNVPHEVVFKASKSNNFYLSLLLTMLFLCVLPVGYAIVWLRPSWHCGPFSDYNRISEFITNTTRNALPKELHEPLNYLTSSSTVIPLLLLLILIIYYLVSLTGALREANQDLRTQLQKEREEERKKIFKVPETKPPETTTTSLTSRWRKVLEASSPVTPTQPPDFETEEYKNKARKELISRIMKEALRKGSATSDDDSVVRRDDDDTDTEHHDSLPHDEEGKEKRFGLSKLQQIRRTRKPSLVDIVQIAKSEREREQRGSLTPTAKGTHTKGSLKGDKHERKKFDKDKEREKEKETEQKDVGKETGKDKEIESKQSESNDNDPEINSRIVNERRQSLLRRKREDEQQAPSEMPIKKNTQEQHTPRNVVDNKRNKFELVDEKKPPAPPARAATTEPHEQPAHHHHHSFGIRGGTFKLRRPRSKAASSTATEPEVFKFDEKSVEKAHSNGNGNGNGKHGSPNESHSAKLGSEAHAARFSDGLTTPTFIPALYRQANPEKLVRDFSRQSRKKIGSLLALVRDAVNTKRNEEEQHQHQADSAGPTTPTAGAMPAPAPAAAAAAAAAPPPLSDKDATAIDIPPTPEAEMLPTPTLTPTEIASQPASRQHESARPRTVSQRYKPAERTQTMRQDSQASVWSENIPTITISTTGSEECIVESKEEEQPAPAAPTATAASSRALPPAPTPTTSTASAPTTPDPVVKVVKIRIEDDK